jgi:hypothetical protein
VGNPGRGGRLEPLPLRVGDGRSAPSGGTTSVPESPEEQDERHERRRFPSVERCYRSPRHSCFRRPNRRTARSDRPLPQPEGRNRGGRGSALGALVRWALQGDSGGGRRLPDATDPLPRGRKGYSAEQSRDHGIRDAERVIAAPQKIFGLKATSWKGLPKGDWRKGLVAGLVRSRSLVPNGWVANRLFMGATGAVSRTIRSAQDLATGDCMVRRWLAQLEQMSISPDWPLSPSQVMRICPRRRAIQKPQPFAS